MPLRNSPRIPTQAIRTGAYHFTNNPYLTTTALVTNGLLRLGPWVVTSAITITRIGAEVAVAGSSGSVYRLCIYGDDGTGYPGALILDAGTIDGTSATVQEKTISQALNPGVYWVGGVSQGAPTTHPTIRCSNAQPPLPLSLFATTIPGANAQVLGYADSSAGTTLPATFATTVFGTSTVPRVFIKT